MGMRELKEFEKESVLNKINSFGDSSKLLKNKKLMLNDKDKVFLMTNNLIKITNGFSREQVEHVGIYVGKFTRSKKFHLKISFLDSLATYAKKVVVKDTAEMNELYGNNILNCHIQTIPELVANEHVVVVNTHDIPLGFGITTKSTSALNLAPKTSVAIIRQSDNGEYLRDENVECQNIEV